MRIKPKIFFVNSVCGKKLKPIRICKAHKNIFAIIFVFRSVFVFLFQCSCHMCLSTTWRGSTDVKVAKPSYGVFCIFLCQICFAFAFPGRPRSVFQPLGGDQRLSKSPSSTFGSTASFGNARETKVVRTLQWLQARSIQGKSGPSLIKNEANMSA